VEAGKLTFGVAGGILGGQIGMGLCVAVMAPTTGPVALSCLLIAGGVGGAVFGNWGSEIGATAGEVLYEY